MSFMVGERLGDPFERPVREGHARVLGLSSLDRACLPPQRIAGTGTRSRAASTPAPTSTRRSTGLRAGTARTSRRCHPGGWSVPRSSSTRVRRLSTTRTTFSRSTAGDRPGDVGGHQDGHLGSTVGGRHRQRRHVLRVQPSFARALSQAAWTEADVFSGPNHRPVILRLQPLSIATRWYCPALVGRSVMS
jgi:hypothetical protein